MRDPQKSVVVLGLKWTVFPTLEPALKEFLHAVGKRYQLAIVTRSPLPFVRNALNEVGLGKLFREEQIFSSSELFGSVHPVALAKTYLLAAEVMRLKTVDRVAFVGTLPAAWAANKAGFCAVGYIGDVLPQKVRGKGEERAELLRNEGAAVTITALDEMYRLFENLGMPIF